MASQDKITRKLRIGVMGAGSATPGSDKAAEEVGRLIAESGCILVCGGLGGVMEAAARGASGAGGTVVGILPGADARDANPYVDIPIATGMGHARNVINIHTSNAVIAIEGSYGTLSEIAIALKAGKPVVSLGSWALKDIGCDSPLFHTATTPEEAVALAVKLAGENR